MDTTVHKDKTVPPQAMTTCPNCGVWTDRKAVLRTGCDGIVRRFCEATPDICFAAHEEALRSGDHTDPDSKINDQFDRKAG